MISLLKFSCYFSLYILILVHHRFSEFYFPIFSSIDLTNITAAVYSTELCKRLRAFLSALPPSSPQAHVNELLVAAADFERDLESWNIRFVKETSPMLMQNAI